MVAHTRCPSSVGVCPQAFNPTRAAGMRYWQEPELQELVAMVGLEQYERDRRFQYIMFTARKPE